MTEKRKIIELLDWMDKAGLKPVKPSRNDRYLILLTDEIKSLSHLLPHQRKVSLWIPSIKGLRRLGIDLESGKIDSLVTVTIPDVDLIGAGSGEAEAILSLFNQVRAKAA